MSRTSRWDYQLYQIERVIMDLARQASLALDPAVQDSTIQDRDQIDADLAQISIEADKVIQASKKSKNADPSNAAIGWWSKQLVTKIKLLATEYVALQNRKMWLRLLQARFSGISAKDSLELEARHLVDLAIRKKQLDDLEAMLRRDLEAIAIERDRLKDEYVSIGIADENWSASGSFQSRLGINLDHARQNPSSCALSECLNVIGVPSFYPEEELWLRKANDDVLRKSGTLTQQSRELASAMAQGLIPADKMGTASFKNTMDQVSALTENVFKRFNSIQGRPNKVSRPKVVQSSKKADKTIAHP